MTANLALLHQLWEMMKGIQNDPVARSHFDLSTFVEDVGVTGEGNDARLVTPDELHERLVHADVGCGTVGCVWGFASICIPEIAEGAGPHDFGVSLIAYKLGIEYREAERIFMPGSYLYESHPITPTMVIKRLEDLIRLKP